MNGYQFIRGKKESLLWLENVLHKRNYAINSYLHKFLTPYGQPNETDALDGLSPKETMFGLGGVLDDVFQAGDESETSDILIDYSVEQLS